MGHRLRAGLAQGRRLGLASRLGQRLSVRGEVDGEPQPDRYLELEAGGTTDLVGGCLREPEEVGHEDHGDQGGRDLNDEHDRVLGQLERVHLSHSRAEGAAQQLGVEDAPVTWGAGGARLAVFPGHAAGSAGGVDHRE